MTDVYKKDAISCNDCRKFHELKDKNPNCINCNRYKLYSKLSNEDILVISILNKYISFMIDGMGGINSYGVIKILELLEVEDDILDKLLLSIHIIVKVSNEVADDQK